MEERLETINEIKQSYAKRAAGNAHLKYTFPVYQQHVVRERQSIYSDALKSHKRPAGELEFMEIGAGGGHNLPFFKSLGLRWENIHVNELLDDRVESIRSRFPTPNIYPGDALNLPFKSRFDIVFQSTVFTSITSDPFRVALAQKLWDMVRDDGMILWYDFVYDNPNNPDVRKVTRQDVLRLFPEAKSIDFHSVTLAPPIGRRIGRAYSWMNALFPFLRSHLIAVIRK